MKKPYTIETIEQYLTNQLEGQALHDFEQALATDEELATAVAEHQDAMFGIGLFGEQELRSDIQRTEGELDEEGFFLVTSDLDDYLEGKASSETRTKIEHRRTTDAEFSKKMELHNDTRQSIELLGEELLRDNIKSIESELESEGFFEEKAEQVERPIRTLGRRVTLRRVLAAAASVAILVMAYVFFLQPDDSPQGLYASYYEQYDSGLAQELELQLSETGFGTTDDMKVQLNLLLDGVQAYKNGDFNEAIQKLNTYRSANTDETANLYQQATLYQALAHQQLEEGQEAIDLLQPLANTPDFNQQQDAKWYLALAYLQAEQTDEAQATLEDLSQTELYGNTATNLLETLNE